MAPDTRATTGIASVRFFKVKVIFVLTLHKYLQAHAHTHTPSLASIYLNAATTYIVLVRFLKPEVVLVFKLLLFFQRFFISLEFCHLLCIPVPGRKTGHWLNSFIHIYSNIFHMQPSPGG